MGAACASNVDFVDPLTYGSASTPGTLKIYQEWH